MGQQCSTDCTTPSKNRSLTGSVKDIEFIELDHRSPALITNLNLEGVTISPDNKDLKKSNERESSSYEVKFDKES
jgi:hypothetical protein